MTSPKYDPRGLVSVWLDCFASYPRELRPTFVFRRLTSAEYEEVSAALHMDPPPEIDTNPEARKQFMEEWRKSCASAMLVGLVEVQNMVYPDSGEQVPILGVTDVDELRRIVNPAEVVQVLSKRLAGGSLEPDEKKVFASSS